MSLKISQKFRGKHQTFTNTYVKKHLQTAISQSINFTLELLLFQNRIQPYSEYKYVIAQNLKV